MTDYESSSLWNDEPMHSMVGLEGLPPRPTIERGFGCGGSSAKS
jgi:hypothetical protein